jgi:hypothetical protein
MDWLYFAQKLPSTTGYWRKDKGGIEVTGRRGRRCKKLLGDFKEMRGYSYLKEEALDRTMWRVGFGRGFGLVVRQTKIKFVRIFASTSELRWGSACDQLRSKGAVEVISVKDEAPGREFLQYYYCQPCWYPEGMSPRGGVRLCLTVPRVNEINSITTLVPWTAECVCAV